MRHPALRRSPVAVVAAALVSTALTAPAQPALAAADRPGLTFANRTVHSVLGRAYEGALRNLIDVNTVRYDPAEYNQTGLLTDPPGTFVRAGGGYAQPWTRDAAVNSWNAASLLEPQVARNTLWSVVRRQADGQLVVQQDNQWWDQVVWATGAWNHYLVTGDTAFLVDAYQVAVNTLTIRRQQNYNATYGLFGGGSFFNDGVAGYPAPPADDQESKGGFVSSYPATNTMMALSTNAIYYDAYRSAALMATALGRPAAEASTLSGMADSIKSNINARLWRPQQGTYGYFLHGEGQVAGTVDPSEEGTGLSLVILFDIADAAKARSIMANTHVQPYGIVDVWPHFRRYSDDRPGRHNVTVWPMVQALWGHAAAKSGDQQRFAFETATLAKLANGSNGFYEIYHARTGAVDGGWQTGSHWRSEPDQTWSATGYLRMIHNGLFGIGTTSSAMTFAPMLPAGWGDVTLSDLRYRNMTLNVTLRGSGNQISTVKIDGQPGTASVPANWTGTHTVEITLTAGADGDRDGDTVRDAHDACPDEAGTTSGRGCPDETTFLEAENARLTGGAQVNTNHTGYSGSGFVDGYWSAKATTAFTVNTAAAGRFAVTLRYANGTGSAQTLGLYVNGVRTRQISLAPLGTWDTWGTQTETVALGLGSNTVSYRYDGTDSGYVNLDSLSMSVVDAAQNLARARPTTASGSCDTGEGPEKAVNGSVRGGNSDKWCAAADGDDWLRVDLGSTASLSRLVVRHAAAGGEGAALTTRAFRLETSTDGAAWTSVASVADNTAAVTAHRFAPVSGRYVRLVVTDPEQSAGTRGAARVYELEVYA